MRKEFDMMLIVVVSAILGVVCAAIVNVLYTQSVITDTMLSGITIGNLGFIIFFLWLMVGIIMGVLKD